MPRYVIETSLFESVTIEVAGGRTYESAPLTMRLIREVGKLDEEQRAGTLDNVAYVIQAIGVIFGLKPEELESIDVRVLTKMLEYATDAMRIGKPGEATKTASPAVTEAEPEKNGQTPGSEPLP